MSGFQNFFLIIHLVAAAVGVGSITLAEVLYFKFKMMIGGQANPARNSLFRLIFIVERVSLMVLIVSGIALISLGGKDFLEDQKLLAKLAILIILLFDSRGWQSNHVPIPLWSAVSLTSWYMTFILGAWRTLDISFGTAMLSYVVTLTFVFMGLNLIRKSLGIKTF